MVEKIRQAYVKHNSPSRDAFPESSEESARTFHPNLSEVQLEHTESPSDSYIPEDNLIGNLPI